MWCGVDFLFIDEVSMISCQFLCQISERLSVAKGNSSAFGGINIIFAGKFVQLPPIWETKLFAYIKPSFNLASKLGQNIILGELLWMSVKMVVRDGALLQIISYYNPGSLPAKNIMRMLNGSKPQ